MYVRQSIDLLEGLIPGGDEGKDMKSLHLQKLFIFAVMFSLGAILELEDRKKVKRKTVMIIGINYTIRYRNRLCHRM